MIFVTVGTHEQQFNRLVEYMDIWSLNNEEEVIIQIGFSTYTPKWAKWERMYPYKKVIELIKNSRIVIAHGGPSTFMEALKAGKETIVVPRKLEYGEHVNNHQVLFSRKIEKEMGVITVVENINDLDNLLIKTSVSRVKKIPSNNKEFCEKLKMSVIDMFK